MPEKKGQQGTGKHPQKSTDEPSGSEKGKSGGAGTARAKEESKQTTQGGASDLKEREYRDKDGNIHHHTRAYEEQHKDEE